MTDKEKIDALERKVERLTNDIGALCDQLEFYRDFFSMHRFCTEDKDNSGELPDE